MELLKPYIRAILHLVLTVSAFIILILLLYFPYDLDAPLTNEEIEALRKYYTEAYKRTDQSEVRSDYNTKYVQVAEQAAKASRIEEKVAQFVADFNLGRLAVLEIGSGRGYLQDLVENYTGLDISPSAARFYRKRFVLGSATAMPFPDNSFDGVWSIWVFEHVPNPEQAFREARRVTKNGGVLYLFPAWNCPSWNAQGYTVRPYSDFGLWGKIIKASLPLRSSQNYRAITLLPVRLVRSIAARFGPTKLRYHRLVPNYKEYWVPDSDAVNSIDIHEAALWFLTRGDECLSCGENPIFLPIVEAPLVIRVNKTHS